MCFQGNNCHAEEARICGTRDHAAKISPASSSPPRNSQKHLHETVETQRYW